MDEANISKFQIIKPTKKSNEEIAKEVLDGKWGNGAERKNALTKAGYNASEVQAKVNELLGNTNHFQDEIFLYIYPNGFVFFKA